MLDIILIILLCVAICLITIAQAGMKAAEQQHKKHVDAIQKQKTNPNFWRQEANFHIKSFDEEYERALSHVMALEAGAEDREYRFNLSGMYLSNCAIHLHDLEKCIKNVVKYEKS